MTSVYFAEHFFLPLCQSDYSHIIPIDHLWKHLSPFKARLLMKRNILFILLLVLAICLTAIVLFKLKDFSQSTSEISSPRHKIDGLAQILAKLPPGSPEATRIGADIRRIREKAAKTRATAENPGLLLEAFAMLKTTRSGRRYAANYKVDALSKAKVAIAGKQADDLPWVERGPGNVSGRARAVIVDASDAANNTWWAASIGGGVWKTMDAGATWTDKTPELTTLTTTTLVQAPSNPDVFYVGTGMGYGRVVDLEGSGIWKSIDHGETWFQLESTANGELLEAVNRIVVDPQNENILLACTNDSFSHLGVEEGPRRSAIFRSIDGGDTWTQVFDPLAVFGDATDNRVQQIVADPTNFNNLYATVNEIGVIKSTDGGQTWSMSADDFALASDVGNPTGSGFGLAGISVRTEMAIAPSDPSRLYAAVERPRGVADLYMSADAGATWTLLPDTGNDPNWFNAFGASGATGAYTAGWFDNTIAVHPYDENVVFVGGVNLYRIDVDPSNNTRTAAQMTDWIAGPGLPRAHSDHHFLTMIPEDASTGTFRILDANDGGIAVSSDGGGSWQQLSGMGTTQFYGMDKKPGENVYFGGMQDNGSWISGMDPNAASQWIPVIGGDGFEAVWNYRDGNLLLGGSQFNNLRRSTDGGQSWNPVIGFPSPPGRSLFITKIANSKVDPDLVFAVSIDGVLRSDDFGANWTTTPIAGNWLGWRPFDNVEVSNADGQVVWISSRMDVDPASGLSGGIHVSIDGGLSFNEVSANFPAELAEASGIATHPTDPNTAYLLFSGPGEPKIMQTVNLGEDWVDISGFGQPAKRGPELSSNGFPDVAVFSLLVMPYNTDILWAGTEIGLFVSNDAGATWEAANNGFPNAAIFELSIVDDQVLAATQGRGVWSVTLPELAGYTPPVNTLSPRLKGLAMLPQGVAGIDVGLRSAYDSTQVLLDGSPFLSLGPNASALDTLLLYPVTEAKTISVTTTAYKDGRAFLSPTRTLEVFPATSVTTYLNTLDEPAAADDFTGLGFSIAQPAGFDDSAIHSAHPYANATDVVYQLKVPVEVAHGNAILTYDDIALIEEGVVDDYTQANFFDYVIVEGTKDGVNWLPLAPGYDARANAQWQQAYRSGIPPGGQDSSTPGDPSMFVSHTINLLDTFAPRDVIFIRFRLHADPLAFAWGWAIDNISIQPNAIVSTEDESTPTAFRLHQNYPNPFNPQTTIPFSIDEPSRVTLSIYDVAGRKVSDLILDESRPSGLHTISFEASRLASGTYLYRLQASPLAGQGRVHVETRRMTVVK